VQEKCFHVLRDLRCNWMPDPEVVLREALKAIGSGSDHLTTNPELFEIYRRQLYRRLKKQYHPLLALLVPVHFIWQVNTTWIMIKQRPTDDQTYEQVRKAILTPQPNDKYDYETAMEGPKIIGHHKAGPDTLRMLEHELIQSEFHPTPEQIKAFYENVGVSKPYLKPFAQRRTGLSDYVSRTRK